MQLKLVEAMSCRTQHRPGNEVVYERPASCIFSSTLPPERAAKKHLIHPIVLSKEASAQFRGQGLTAICFRFLWGNVQLPFAVVVAYR